MKYNEFIKKVTDIGMLTLYDNEGNQVYTDDIFDHFNELEIESIDCFYSGEVVATLKDPFVTYYRVNTYNDIVVIECSYDNGNSYDFAFGYELKKFTGLMFMQYINRMNELENLGFTFMVTPKK